MRNRFPFFPFYGFLPLRNADGAGGGAGGGAAPDAGAPADPAIAAAAAAVASEAPVAKWFESDRFNADEKTWLASRGLTGIEDPVEAAIKMGKGHRMAEQRLGKGVDSIMDRPAKDQPLSDFMKANREVFGLPETAEGYKTDQPTDWPTDLPWTNELDAKAQALAFERGVPPELHKAYVGLVAEYQKSLSDGVDAAVEKARVDMMAEVRKDWGAQTDAKLAQARQALNYFGTEAGLTSDGMQAALSALNEKTGDPAVMKLFAAIATGMGEDKAIGLGNGGGGMVTPADAKSQIAAMSAPGGEYFEAMKANREGGAGTAERFKTAKAKVEALSRIASEG